MVKRKEPLETTQELERQIAIRQEKLREQKRADSEIELQLAVQDMNTEQEDMNRIMKACYSYLANHRNIKKNSIPSPVTQSY